jgi:hypothetical protein
VPEPYFTPDQLANDGSPTWLNALAGEGSDPNHLVHVVRHLDPADALELLGVDRQEIRPCVLPDREPADRASLARTAIAPLDPIVVLIAGRVGEWTFVYDDLGETGYLWHLEPRPPVNATAALSAEGEVAATASVSITGHTGFTYAVGGYIEFLHSAVVFDPADFDTEPPAEVRTVMDAAGAAADDGITMRMICALAGLPRTLGELRDVQLVIAPHESRPYLFG